MQTFKNIAIIILILFCNLIIIIKGCYYTNHDKGPCDDFYDYACKNYSHENPDTNYSEITQKLDYEMNKKLLKSLQYLTKHRAIGNEKQNFNDKMFLYWTSCCQEKERNLRKYLEELKPNKELNWPLMESKTSWLSSNETFNLWSLLGQIQSYGLNNIIIKTEITRNIDNSLNIWLAPASFRAEDFLPSPPILKVLLSLLKLQKDLQPIIKQLQFFEIKWHNIVKKYGYTHQLKQVNLQQLAQIYPRLNLSLYLEHLLGKSELNNITLITLEDPKYFEFLNKKSWSIKELKHLANYLMIKFLYYLAQDSTKEFTALECLKDLRNKFDLAVNFLYYKDYFNFQPQRFRLYFDNLLYKIRATMLQYFEQNYLNLSRVQINYLKNKLKAIKINIGNLPENFNYHKIENFYQDLPNLSKENYYKNHLFLLKHRFHKSLLFTQNQTHYVITSNQLGSLSSPFYVAQQNMVIIPFASFQMPFFQYLKTPLEQLPIFGFVFAHELTHAFDTSGLLYDHQGFPLPYPSDIILHNNFSKSLNCMQQQDPTEDIDERIADLFAVRVIYRTYMIYYAKGQDGWQQQIFRNLAQFFCGKDDIKFIDHDSDPIRLKQIVTNFSPFSLAFGCAKNSRMYKKNKCRLY